MITSTTANELYIHIPTDLKNKVDSIFKGVTQKNLNKIYFLVWEINKFTYKQIHSREYNTRLAIGNGLTISSILNKLLNHSVLYLHDEYQIGVKSKSYSLVSRYSAKPNKETDFQLYYNSDKTKLPTWVQNHLKQFKRKVETETVQAETSIIQQQADLIKRLQLEIASLKANSVTQVNEEPKAIVSTPEEVKAKHDVVTSSMELVTKTGVKITLIDAEKYSDKVIQQLVKNYLPTMKFIVVTGDDKRNMWFVNDDSKVQLKAN